jgi:hypothetical protein
VLFAVLGLRFRNVAVTTLHIVASGVLAVGWLATVVIWGHCHTFNGPDDNYWYTGKLEHNLEYACRSNYAVCYQVNLIQDPLHNLVAVNMNLGTALVAIAAAVTAL